MSRSCCSLLRMRLRRADTRVLPVKHASAAIKALDGKIADLAALVTDIRLPGGSDGWEVARHARELRADLPVVYVTADSVTDWPAKGVPNSVVVQKPYAAIQLLTAVATLITKGDSSGAS